jgi:hypothetical protein
MIYLIANPAHSASVFWSQVDRSSVLAEGFANYEDCLRRLASLSMLDGFFADDAPEAALHIEQRS